MTSNQQQKQKDKNDNINTKNNNNNNIITLLSNACGSAMASIISRLCTHPLDTIKARIQIYNYNTTSNNTATNTNSIALSKRYNTLKFYSQILTNNNNRTLTGAVGGGNTGTTIISSYIEIIKNLYRGLGVVIIGGTPGTMIYLCTYDIVKHQLLSSFYSSPSSSSSSSSSSSKNNNNDISHENNKYNFIIHFISGMVAETMACIIYVPVDVIKERMQVQQQQQTTIKNITITTDTKTNIYYRNTYDAIQQIIKSEGIYGIYRGYYATLASFGPFSAFYFVFYEYFKNYCINFYNNNNHNNKNNNRKQFPWYNSQTQKQQQVATTTTQSQSSYVDLPFYYTVLCAATAGGLASFITSPLDMAKLRLQVQRGNIYNAQQVIVGSGTNSTQYYTGIIDCLQKTYYHDGIKGLFRGAGARVLHFAPATTVTMTAYETCRKSFESFFLKQQGYSF